MNGLCRIAVVAVLVLVPVDASAQVCSWAFKAEADTTNIAFPDDSANYWVTRFHAVPGSRIVIRGDYTFARYFSFHVYDEPQRPVHGLADFEIAPDEGSGNPYWDPSQPAGDPRRYTVAVEFGPKPENPAPNTLYAGDLFVGDTSYQNPAGMIIYRVYVGDDPGSIEGSVPLPEVTLELPGGAAVPFASCESAPSPPTQRALTDAIRDANYPDQAPRRYVLASDPPSFDVFYGLVGDRGGFYSNTHISYFRAFVSRQYGDLVTFRAKAPSAPDTRNGEPIFRVEDDGAGGTTEVWPEVRYWSVCQTEFVTQRYVECAADYETARDDDGFMTFVISDPEDRPANATPENGVTWLPYGGNSPGGMILYRHMIPHASFEQAIQRVPQGTAPESVMGESMPVGTYCTPEVFESGGASAAASFAACAQ